MRTILATLALLVSASWTMAAETYTLDPLHTTVTWQASHFGFSNPSGKFYKQSGTLLLDEKNPAASKLDVTIAIDGLSTGNAQFDRHLLSKDFFDAETYPTARFVSTKVQPLGDNRARVLGDLTLHGVTKPVLLDVTLNKLGEGPMNKKKTAGFSAIGVLNRSDFGISYALPGVSDEVKLMIEAEASPAETAAGADKTGKPSANPKIR